jgi:uncharacterized protein YaiL (DUF2058 family)
MSEALGRLKLRVRARPRKAVAFRGSVGQSCSLRTMQSLRDKLLKAGLITAEQAKARPKPEPAQPREPAPAREPEPPPEPGSKAHHRLQALQQRESDRKLQSLARDGEVRRQEGAEVFHFVTRKGKVRRIDLSAEQARALAEGKLAVVECPEPAQIEHVLVRAETAEKMASLSPKAVRFWNREGAPIGCDAGEAEGDAEGALRPTGSPPGDS